MSNFLQEVLVNPRLIQNPSGKRVRWAAIGEVVEGDLGGGVLSLAESGAVVRALEDLAVKVDGGLEPGRVVRTFPNARVGRQVEAAPLGQLLQLVLVHFFSPVLFSPPLCESVPDPTVLGAPKLGSGNGRSPGRSDRRRFWVGSKVDLGFWGPAGNGSG